MARTNESACLGVVGGKVGGVGSVYSCPEAEVLVGYRVRAPSRLRRPTRRCRRTGGGSVLNRRGAVDVYTPATLQRPPAADRLSVGRRVRPGRPRLARGVSFDPVSDLHPKLAVTVASAAEWKRWGVNRFFAQEV